MTDLDALRRAMRTPPDQQFSALDVTAIMATGKRIRRRRRILVSGGAVLATAAAVVVPRVVNQDTTPADPPPIPTVSVTPPSPTPVQPLGDIVYTGIRDEKGEVVFYFYPTSGVELPKVHFGIASGHMTPTGLIPGVANNEVNPDRAGDAPGFHPIMGGDSPTGTFQPLFGYFVGPVARIESKVLGKTVRAQFKPWSHDPSIVVFWFTQESVPEAKLLGRPVAYDAQGIRLN